MARHIATVGAGTVAGLAIFVGTFALWMRYGADPNQDSLLPVRFRFRRTSR